MDGTLSDVSLRIDALKGVGGLQMKLVLGESRIPLSAKDQTMSPSSYLLLVHCSWWYSSCVHLEGEGGLQMELVLLEEGKESRIPLSAKGGVKGI